MNKTVKRIKGILTAVMYVAIFYGVTLIVQFTYTLWQNFSGEIEISKIEINIINGTYALNVISMIITFWIYLLIGKVRRKPILKSVLNDAVTPMTIIMMLCLAIGMRMLVTVYYSASKNSEFLTKSIDSASAITPDLSGIGQIATALFCIIIVAPLFEELLFRALIMSELRQIVRPWAANFLQALMFGVAHAVLFQSIFTFVMGLVFGALYGRVKSIKALAICHGMFNLSVVLVPGVFLATSGIILTVLGILLTVLPIVYIYGTTEKDNFI